MTLELSKRSYWQLPHAVLFRSTAQCTPLSATSNQSFDSVCQYMTVPKVGIGKLLGSSACCLRGGLLFRLREGPKGV